MLSSKKRTSSEFSSELSSTINSASLLPGNSDSASEVLKTTQNKILLISSYSCYTQWLWCSSNRVILHLSIASTSTEETPSTSMTLLWASALNWPWRSVWRQAASDGRPTGISSHSTDMWSYLTGGFLLRLIETITHSLLRFRFRGQILQLVKLHIQTLMCEEDTDSCLCQPVMAMPFMLTPPDKEAATFSHCKWLSTCCCVLGTQV